MKQRFSRLIVTIAIASLFWAKASYAQEVRTSAPCSPIIDQTQGSVTVTFSGGCTAGISSAELKDIIDSVLAQRAIPPELLDRYDRVSRAFGVTDAALTTFFRILGETRVAPEDLDAKLREIAGRHVTLLKQAEAAPDDDPQLAAIKREAVSAISAGDYGRAETLLQNIFDAEDAAGRRAREASNRHFLEAAKTKANLGELKLTQLQFAAAAADFQAAADRVPPEAPMIRSGYLTSLGRAARSAGNYPLASTALRQALTIRQRLLDPEHPDVASSLNDLALLHQDQGHYREAEPLFKDALQVRRKILGPRDPDTLTSLNNLASLFVAQGRRREAEPLLMGALQARREVLGPRHPDTLTSVDSLANLHVVQGRYDAAEPLFMEALRVRREVPGPRRPDTLTSLNNLASLYVAQARYGEAEVFLREALQGRREVFGPHHPAVLTSLNSLADLYQDQGRYGEAEPLYREALQARREALGPRHPDTLTSLSNLAGLFLAEGRYATAEPLYREVLAVRGDELGPRHPDTLASLSNLAGLYQAEGRYGEAEPLQREALAVRREELGTRHPDTLASLSNLAGLYQAEGRYSEAEPLYRAALEARREVVGPRHPDTLAAQRNMAVLLVNQGRHAEAARLLQQMEPNLLGWIGQELYSTEAGVVRRRLVSSQATFQDVVLTLATTSDSREARRLAGAIMLHFKLLQGEEDEYLARLARRSQDQRVRTLADEAGKLRIAVARVPRAGRDAVDTALQALEAKQRALSEASRDYRDHLRVQTANLDDVRASLPMDAVLVEFREFQRFDFQTGKRGEPRFAALLLTDGDEPVVADIGPVSELQRQGATLSDAAAAALHQRLFAPFEEKLAAATTVYVAVDGILNLVSFAQLKLADGRYWAERQTVRLLQTGRDLLRPDPDRPARGLLALGGIDFGAAVKHDPWDSIFFDGSISRAGFAPLPASAAEAKEVTEWYQLLRNEPVEVWSGAEASKARLMALRSPPRVLHLATHGFDRPGSSPEPMLSSGIVLAGANREFAGDVSDGLLFALEAQGLNLDGTELVVLSACDTARGNLDYSEGVFGLARAMRIAGARNVLVTLWPVYDGEARDFMVEFYKNWLTQVRSDPARALRDTQLSWMKMDGRRDPKVWAPYVLIE